MVSISAKVRLQPIAPLKFTPTEDKKIGNLIVSSVKDRVQRRNEGVNDSAMPEYSTRPIYVRVGKYAGMAVLKRGRVPIIALDGLRRAGAKIIDIRKGPARSKGALKNAVVRTGNSIRFPNRAAYKKFLGRSGRRDLTETGAMLRALVVLSTSGVYAKVITIGFRSAKESGKAQGNQRYANWFGMSPSDTSKVVNLVTEMVSKKLSIPTAFVSGSFDFSATSNL